MTDAPPPTAAADPVPAATARAVLVCLWLLNVPLGMWMARGYYLAAEEATSTAGGQVMSLWLLAVGVAIVLAPGMLGALGLATLHWRRTAVALAVAWTVVSHALLLCDSVAFHLLRTHLRAPLVVGALGEEGGVDGIGASAATLWSAAGALVLVAAVECGVVACLWAMARRTGGFARVRRAVGSVPLVVRLGAVGALVLPGLAGAVADPRGPELAVARHFLFPLAPADPHESDLTNRLDHAVREALDGQRLVSEWPWAPGAGRLAAMPSRPNILFLCIESLRVDVVTPETMPNLARFERECVVARHHYVEGNCTHLSLFAAMAGLHPLWYGQARRERATPVPLAWLREAGYTLHAIGSSRLAWIGMGQVVFPRGLFATHTELRDYPLRSDPQVCRRLLAIARAARGPFLAFGMLDSTHFHYYYPAAAEHFRPAAPATLHALNVFALKSNPTALWNRYRNSARYVDGLVGQLVDTLRGEGLLDNTILVITGDHGEAFLDDGVFGHGTSFHEVQFHVPLLIRYPDGHHREVTGLTQNADLFPSLFAEMGAPPATVARLPGRRTLRRGADEQRSWALTCLSAPHTPVQFVLLTDRLKAQFNFYPTIYGEPSFETMALTNRWGQPLAPDTEADAIRRVTHCVAAWLGEQRYLAPAN